MIKYRPATFLSLLLPYLLLGVIPSQGTIDPNNNYETNKGYDYYWKGSLTRNGDLKDNDNDNWDWDVISPGTIRCTGKGDFNDAVKTFNKKFPTESQKEDRERDFILIEGYTRQSFKKSIYVEENNPVEDISSLISKNIEFFPHHLDLAKVKNLNGFKGFRKDIIDKFTIISFSSPNNNDIILQNELPYAERLNFKEMIPLNFLKRLVKNKNTIRGRLKVISVDLSESEDVKESLKKVLELGKFNNIKIIIELPKLLDDDYRNYISAKLEDQGWIVDSLLKGGKIVKLIRNSFENNCSSSEDDDIFSFEKEGEWDKLKKKQEKKWEKLKKNIKQLLDKGADIDAREGGKCNPLSIAANYGDFRLCLFLIDHGASANVQKDWLCNPLLQAISSNNLEITALFLEKGAEVIQKKGNATSPLDLAKGNKEMVTLLKTYLNAEKKKK